ncbi:MAG: hypothetical protein EOM24_36050, partial [Chloroflexia bacterium]|nr:hypothetical protein [Chloroflexia bacterium]
MAEPERISTQRGAEGSSSAEQDFSQIHLYIEDNASNVYEAMVSKFMRVGQLATDFFEEREWPTRGPNGQPMRGVVERADSDNPERTVRLNPSHTLEEAGV